MRLFTRSIIIIALILTLSVFISDALANVKNTAKIYFMPFEVETFGQISKNEIEENSHFSFAFYGESIFCRWLINQLEQSRKVEKIDNFKIRLKFEDVEHMKTYYIDQKGVVERSDGVIFRLNQNQMENIQEKLESFSGVIDLKVQNKVQIE